MEEKKTGSLVIALSKHKHVVIDGNIKIEIPDSYFDPDARRRSGSEIRIRITAPLETPIERVDDRDNG